MEKLITRKEAAKILGISLATLDEARNWRSNAGFHISILLHKRRQSLIQRGFTQNQPNYKFMFLYAAPRGNGVKMA